MEEKQLYGNLTVYRERGAYLRRLEQYEKAKSAYDEAYKTNPEDVRLLIGRSQVCADVGKPEQAYKDAELALKLEPRNMNARNVQALAMYTMSDFERSVVMNYRGVRARRQPPYFEDGISQGLETIQDCVGQNAGDVMLEFLPIIKEQEARRGEEFEPDLIKHVSRIPKAKIKKKLTQLQARRHKTLSRVLAMKYLGPMAYDKFFLQDLLKDDRIMSANAEGSNELKKIIKDTLETLTLRQEIMRSQRPYYCIKRAEKSESRYLTNYKQQTLIQEQAVATSNAERLLKEICKCLHERRIMDMMAKAKRMQIFLDTKTPRTLPNKNAYISRLYSKVAEGYFCQHRLSYRLSERSNRNRIAFLFGIPTGRPKSYDSVIANYPYKFGDLKQAMEKALADLDMCENALMRCWLLYELARMSNTQKNYAFGKFYAKQCQREAEKIDSVMWWLNGCFMLMSGDMQQGNTHDVMNLIQDAYLWTNNLGNSETTRAFLYRCARVVSETVIADEQKAVVKREQDIVKVLDPELKDEAKVFFKRMAAIPTGRRFAVLPRPRQPVYTSERRRARQQGLTVVPGQVKSLPVPPRSNVLGFQYFDI